MMRQALAAALAAAASQLGAPAPAAAPAVRAAPRGTGKRRKGRRITPLPVSRTRWLQSDVETARHMASQGDLSLVGQLARSLRRDGVYQGLMGTRTEGLVRLPKRFSGDPEAVAYLQGSEGKPGHFDAIFPASELAMLDADGIVVGVGLGELVDLDGVPHPVMVRQDPEYLRYRWWEDRWYYQTIDGLLPITPGDGRWILHLRGGRVDPWNGGNWEALSRAYIEKEHSFFLRGNWNSKLANPARVATAPQGASEPQKQAWFRQVMAWGINTVFGMTPGYDVKLLESNGRGYESFRQTIEDCNREFMICIAGQEVTVTGGAGFANANIHATIRSDLIQGDAEALAETLTSQALPWVLPEHLRLVGARAQVAWDTRPPANLKAEAESLSAAAKAIEDCRSALAGEGLELDTRAVAARFSLPVKGDMNGDGSPDDEGAQLPGPPPDMRLPASTMPEETPMPEVAP